MCVNRYSKMIKTIGLGALDARPSLISAGASVDMCVDMCAQICVHMCAFVCLDMCRDVYVYC